MIRSTQSVKESTLVQTEEVTIVDGDDNVIGSLPRYKMKETESICRVTYILVFNTDGQLLVQKRTPDKDQYPGLLDLAAGGVLVFNESYEASASRELQEELGIAAELVSKGDVYFEDTSGTSIYRSWGRVFTCENNGPFTLQPEEIDSVEFMDLDKVLKLDQALITPDTRQVLVSYLL